MKVLERVVIKRRGPVFIIDELPAELNCGAFVLGPHPSIPNRGSWSRFWEVSGIETHAMPRSHTNGQTAGLLLSDAHLKHFGEPAIGETLYVYVPGGG